MSQPARYRIFLSAVSGELASYRKEVTRVLSRKGIEVCEQRDFRQGGATLLDALHNYIAECDAIICLIGDRTGSLPTAQHMAVMGDVDSVSQFREASGEKAVSYTQWEFLLAKSLNLRSILGDASLRIAACSLLSGTTRHRPAQAFSLEG